MRAFDESFDWGFFNTTTTIYSEDNMPGLPYLGTISKKIYVGAETNFASYTATGSALSNRYKYWSVSVEFNFYYVRKGKWRIYSGLSFGYMQESNVEKSIRTSATAQTKNSTLAVHITGIGGEYSKGVINSFAELGAGTNGGITAGIRIRI